MLPNIDTRVIETVKLPVNKEKIMIKPYKSSQEKALLLSLADKSNRINWLNNIRQVLKQNIVEGDLSKVNNTVDFIYLIVKLRSMSKGERFAYTFRCPNIIDDNQCDHIFDESDLIDEILKVKNIDTSKIIHEINDSVSVEIAISDLKYFEYLCGLSEDDEGQLEDLIKTDKEVLEIKERLELVINELSYAIKAIFIKDDNGKQKIYKDITPDEVATKLLDNLTLQEIEDIFKRKSEMAHIVLRLEKKCPKCEYIYMKEITNFFAFIA